jgi:hypothetical protein
MSNPKEELTRVLVSAEKAAYARGWADACAAMIKAASEAQDHFADKDERHVEAGSPQAPSASMPTPRRTGRPSSNAIEVVEDCINASPGKKGVDVVRAAQLVDPSIPERTVRTCLRRLKLSKKIWQRNHLWYPKPRPRHENENEEAISSPPHH